MARPVARVPKKNNVTMTLLKTTVELERKNFQNRFLSNKKKKDKPIGRQISKKRKTLKEQLSEMEDQLKNAQEEIVSLRSLPISHGNFLAQQIEFNQKDALIHQLHFYYRWHFSKNANYTRWSKLRKAEQKKWTEEWAKIREVQKVQAAQGLIVLSSQIKDEVEDEPK